MPSRSRSGDHPLITVLGAGGFLGSAVVAELRRRPVRLRAVGRRPATLPGSGPRLQAIATDLFDPRAVADVVTGADAVIVLAAHRTPTAQWRVSGEDPMARRITVDLLDTVVESLAVSAVSPRLPVVLMAGTVLPDDPAAATCDPYTRLKSAAEDVLITASRSGRIAGSSLRLPTVYGCAGLGTPVIDQGVVTAMARRALAGEPLTIWHAVIRTLLQVRDAASAFADAVDHGAALSGRCWDVGGDHPTRLDLLFQQIAQLAAEQTTSAPVAVVHTPPPAHAAPVDGADVSADSRPFRAVTGWRPQVPDTDGLRELVESLAADTDNHRQRHHTRRELEEAS